jgi:phosphate transport system permease protein
MTSYAYRKFKNKLFLALSLGCVIIAAVPLLSILIEVILKGAPELSIKFLTQTGGVIGSSDAGGIGPAIQGTLILVGLTCLISMPFGVMSGIFLAEHGNNEYASAYAAWMRIFNNALTGVPSIVVGITVFAVVVLTLGHYSPLAGAVALSFIAIPIVARTTEESLKLVPNSVREASLALGVRNWRTTISVVLPDARKGLVTGALLATARIAGETAPLLMTILGGQYFFQGFGQPMDALPLRIYRDAFLPYSNFQAQAWGAALFLILIVLSLNIGVRAASSGWLGK